jgi:hypothetical protein
MLKRITLLILAAVLLFTAAACGGEEKKRDVAAFGEKVLNEIEFQDSMSPLRDNLLAQLYGGLKDEDITARSIYTSTGYTPEEIVVIEAKDTAAAEKIEAALKQRIVEQRTSFENYIPTEMPKLTDPPVRRKGNYVVMIISGDDAKAISLIDGFFK